MPASGSVRFVGTGESTPIASQFVTNDDVLAILRENDVDTRGKNGDDTESLVGIRTRWWSEMSSTEHALAASRAAVDDARARLGNGFTVDKIQLVHSGGSSPDNVFPACSCEVQGALGIPPDDCEGRDISLACASWLDALVLAHDRMRTKGLRYGLVTVGECIGSRLNAPTSLSHCLWGDGGGAVVLEHDPDGDPDFGIVADRAVSDGQFAHWTRSLRLGTHPDHKTFPLLDATMFDHGRDIHRYAIRVVSKLVADMVAAYEAERGKVDGDVWLLPHNSNLGMVRQIAKRAGIDEDRVLTRIVERGNTSSASIPISLAHFAAKGTFRRGDLLVMAAFGGGMSIDVVLYRWP